MALLDRGLKQRIVGALVLVALAVIFLPMLLTREDELRHVRVEAPPMPPMPALPDIRTVPVPIPEPLPDEPVPAEPAAPIGALPLPPVSSAEPRVTPAPAPKAAAEPAPAVRKAPEARLDANNLPVTWSVQLASFSNRDNALKLQKTLRAQGYNAYVRTFESWNRVFVGPVIESAEAKRLRDQLHRQHKLDGKVVRFQPERG
ncbi:MAG TPA: SPOR domain-containing protein [Pseudomonas sp.]|jgi:DedD protein|uniref:SPOR domain-containing protein n=1 Tax=Pseudomonas sp. TaxID=306 RepID=UPI002CBB8698|nr:SPOR domain-containing protein [Pseudomonas sp.]HTO18109.1 SPOR domain-containing protein [Pseudomonas sp.]